MKTDKPVGEMDGADWLELIGRFTSDESVALATYHYIMGLLEQPTDEDRAIACHSVQENLDRDDVWLDTIVNVITFIQEDA